MNTNQFNKEYRDQGGFVMLMEFKAQAASLDTIASWFKVSKERIKQLFIELTGEKYDPRPVRRQRILECMIEFAKNSTEEEFILAFKGANKDYVKFVLEDCHKLGIYGKQQEPNHSKDNESSEKIEIKGDNNMQSGVSTSQDDIQHRQDKQENDSSSL